MSILATVCRCLLVFYNRNEIALGEVTCCWPSGMFLVRHLMEWHRQRQKKTGVSREDVYLVGA